MSKLNIVFLILGTAVWVTCMALLALDAAESKPDPPSEICTIKLNDANDWTSYITGVNVQ